jgi:hypothetical protein
MATGSTGTWEPVLYLVGPTGSTGPTGTFSFSGVTGAILYSPDGTSVTGSGKLVYKEELVSSASALPGIMRGITYDSVGGYVALRTTSFEPPFESFILSSSNGQSWIGVTGPIGGNISGITYGSAGGYVAVGGDGSNTLYLTSSNGVSWTGGTGPIQGLLSAVAYGSTGGYVAVGYDSNTPKNSIYLTSSNGQSWTGGTGPIQALLNGITYNSAGGYVAVGYDNQDPPNPVYLTSSNGQTWTGGTGNIPGGELRGIIYDSAGGYVAVGNDSGDPQNSIYLTSSDGVSWTGSTGPISGILNAVTYHATAGYVAVGSTEINGGLDSLYLTSSNGITWTGGTGPVPGVLFGIAYGPTDGYVAVGTKAGNAGYDALYLTTSDGQSWTGGSINSEGVEIPKTSITIDALIDNNGSTGAPGQVLTAGPTGSALIWADPTITISGTAGSILYSGDGVGVTGSSKLFYGENIISTPVPIPGTLTAVTYGSGGGTIAVGFDNNVPGNTLYLINNDGSGLWTSGTGPIQGQLHAITYDVAGGYVAVGQDANANTIYMTSSNGVSWTGGTGPIAGNLNGIAYCATGGYVAVGYDYLENSLILSSSNGQSWTGTTGPIGGFLYGIAYSSNVGYVAVGTCTLNSQDNTLYLTSSDGVSWTGDTGPIGGFLRGVTYGPTGGYVAVGYTQVNGPNETLYLTSPDGLSWTGNTGPLAGVLYGITYHASYGYVAAGNESTTSNSLYMTSTDGVSWTGGTGPILGIMNGIAYTPIYGYLAVGLRNVGSPTTAFIYSGGAPMWSGSTDLGSTGIMKSSITPDSLYDNVGALGDVGQVITSGSNGQGLVWASAAVPTGGNTGYVLTKASAANYNVIWSLPTTPMGKMIRVDSVYGDDLLGSPGTYAYQTVTAAVVAASNAGPGHTIWVMPGTYNLSNGITIPTGCALRGSSTQTTIIQMCNVTTAFTTLVTMGENTRVEDLTLVLQSSNSNAFPLVGIEFPGTTTVTGKVRTCVLTVNNSNVASNASTSVYGIQATGTGTLGPASFSFNSLKGSTVNIYSNGGGEKRGIMVSGSNTMTTRDMNIYVAAPADSNSSGSYIGIETANSNAKIQCRSTTISGHTSDIKQTQGSIELGPGVDIVNKTAGGCNFTSYVYPTILYYGVKGTLRTSGLTTGYLWPGTLSVDDGNGGNPQYPDSQVAYYRAQQKSVIIGMYATLASNAGVGHGAVVTLQVNDVDTAFSLTFSNATGSASNSYYGGSITLQRFDRISMKLVLDTIGSGNLAHDLSLQIDIF